jgi:hypothetical protein
VPGGFLYAKPALCSALSTLSTRWNASAVLLREAGGAMAQRLASVPRASSGAAVPSACGDAGHSTGRLTVALMTKLFLRHVRHVLGCAWVRVMILEALWLPRSTGCDLVVFFTLRCLL